MPDGFSDFSKLSELGISRVLTDSGALDIYATSAAMQSQVLSAKEGAVAVNVTSSSIGVFDTHLRADPDWQVSVNGQKLKQVQKNDTIFVPVNSGRTNIQLVYYPKRFYFGLLISSVLLFIFTFYFYKSKAFVS